MENGLATAASRQVAAEESYILDATSYTTLRIRHVKRKRKKKEEIRKKGKDPAIFIRPYITFSLSPLEQLINPFRQETFVDKISVFTYTRATVTI